MLSQKIKALSANASGKRRRFFSACSVCLPKELKRACTPGFESLEATTLSCFLTLYGVSLEGTPSPFQK